LHACSPAAAFALEVLAIVALQQVMALMHEGESVVGEAALTAALAAATADSMALT